MMNPTYHFARMRELLDEFEPSRERSLAATKLDECQMWLDRCQPTLAALDRDQAAPAETVASRSERQAHITPVETGEPWRGPAQADWDASR